MCVPVAMEGWETTCVFVSVCGTERCRRWLVIGQIPFQGRVLGRRSKCQRWECAGERAMDLLTANKEGCWAFTEGRVGTSVVCVLLSRYRGVFFKPQQQQQQKDYGHNDLSKKALVQYFFFFFPLWKTDDVHLVLSNAVPAFRNIKGLRFFFFAILVAKTWIFAMHYVSFRLLLSSLLFFFPHPSPPSPSPSPPPSLLLPLP